MTTATKFTAIDDEDRRFLVLPVAAVCDTPAGGQADEASWCAHVCDPANPLAGLYAFATSCATATDAIAAAAWAAISAGELAGFALTSGTLAGIYVVVTTCTVYDSDALTAAIADDAA